ncbi:MFS transporter [Sulfobacillus harzensis]|uniref:MFS transporter n=1 Tax=Sulfobacillus harzensis TaxID=2729629 RepID=A0A7Y0L5E9_9FIRM|nr:MFS transporter [Sulfobacillus harzensis]NMP23287.1 MFS transporter [Sulfobacillus harzensis]
MAAEKANLNKVYASGLLFNVSFLTFAVLIPLDALQQHLPVWIVGILAAIPGVFQMPSRTLSGPLVDLKGERWMLWVTYLLAFLACVAVVAGNIFPVVALITGQLLIGAARGFFWTAAQSEVSRDAENRAHNLGLFTSYTKGGALIGIAAAGSLAEWLGVQGGFAFAGVLAFISLGIGLTLPKRELPHRPRNLWGAVARLWPASRQPFVVVNGLVALLCAIPQALAQSFYPVILIRAGLSDSVASLVTALMSLGMIISGALGAKTLKVLGMKRMVAVSTIMVAVGLAATSLHQIVVDGASIFVAGFAAGWLNVAFLTAVTSRSRDGDRGTNLGVTQVYFVLAMMLTPVLSGWLLQAGGRAMTFVIEGALALAVAIGVLALWRWQNKSGKAVPSEQPA